MRTSAGRRLHADRGVRRLTLFEQLIGAGRRNSDVAGLGLTELGALVEEDRPALGRKFR